MGKVNYSEEGKIGFMTFYNPEKLNPLDFEVLGEMNALMDFIEDESGIECLILTGAGEKAFIAGADIGLQNTFDVTSAYEWACLGHRTLRRLEMLSMPVIGAINGYALGGGMEVALVCDILIASDHAVFGQPEVTLGITPGFGGTQRLCRKVGMNIAKDLVLTGRKISAQEAKEIGLLNQVVSQKELISAAVDTAKRIVCNSSLAVQYAKTAMNEGIQSDLDRGLTMERALFSMCFDTKEQTEAMTAFIEKTNRR